MLRRLLNRRLEGQKARENERMLTALQLLTSATDDERLSALAGVVDWLRPRQANHPEPARLRLQTLTTHVRSNPDPRATLRDTLVWLITAKQPLRLLTDSGVLTGEGFFSGVWRRLSRAILPEELDPAQLKDVVSLIFRRDSDHQWVEALDDDCWVDFFDALDLGASEAQRSQTSPMQILEAMLVVSYRIAALGLEPELVRNHPAIERYESPFLTQNVEMHEFLDERRAANLDQRQPTHDDKHLLVLLDQCEQIIAKVRKQAVQTGASVSLTVLLARLSQNIARLNLMLQALELRPQHELNLLRVRFFKEVVRAENRRHHISELWAQTADLLSVRVITNASKAGEQYITSTRAEFFSLFRSAMGAGLIVVLASMAKIALFDDGRSPMGQALVYSAVYVVAFLLMYVFHFSLATKQPAMTANVIAQTLEGMKDNPRRGLAALTELVVRTFRSQFIALAGNLVIVLPLALYVAEVHWLKFGTHYLSPEKASLILSDAEPLSPHVWFWAVLTGVCLFATGLISGYYDNKAVYARIPQRVAQTRWIQRLLGRSGAERLGAYVENNLGGLMGSALFGVMLGSFGALGKIFGLPLDTLHVTFTSANSVYAVSAAGERATTSFVLPVIAGVVVIGLLNLFVSFSLALLVAMRAQGVQFGAGRALMNEVVRRALTRPQDFFWPPPDPCVVVDADKPIPAKPGAD